MHSSATTKSVHTNTMMPTKEEMIAKYGVYFARLFGLLVIVFPVEYDDTLDRVMVIPMQTHRNKNIFVNFPNGIIMYANPESLKVEDWEVDTVVGDPRKIVDFHKVEIRSYKPRDQVSFLGQAAVVTCAHVDVMNVRIAVENTSSILEVHPAFLTERVSY